MSADILAVGLTTLDILGAPIDALPPEDQGVLINGIETIPAGTAGGFALVAAVLGLNTSLVSAVGDDRMCRFVRMVFAEHRVDTSLTPTLPGFPTSATILPIDSHGRRPTLHAVGASMLMEITEAAIAAAAHARHLHYAAIGGFRIDPDARARLLQAARQAGASITCDLIAPGPTAAEELAAILPHVDVFLPSLAEATHLTGHTDPAQAANALRALGAQVCILKLGRAGALIATADGHETVPAFDVETVDTTSCGDAFCAGFVAARLRGGTLAESCRLAAAVAALVAQGLGTLGKLTDFAQAAHNAATLTPRSAA